MKTAREYIRRITVVKSNLQHIADTGAINGSLLADIDRSMREYAKELAREALKNAANNACIIEYIDGENPSYTIGGSYSCPGDETPVTVEIYKQSITNESNIPEI